MSCAAKQRYWRSAERISVFINQPSTSSKTADVVAENRSRMKGRWLTNKQHPMFRTLRIREVLAISVSLALYASLLPKKLHAQRTPTSSENNEASAESTETSAARAHTEVSVVGKSAVKKVKESAYNVAAVDAKALHNTTLDLSQALDRVSGVRIRQDGGVGSSTNLMLNGFTGQHVKFFLDGVPMEGFGSSFQINNIPINMADRIEIYKGVVPIDFGSDALGGAINIVTSKRQSSFLDASASYGSFGTIKSYVNARYTSKSGLTVNLNAFQNYSDNDYQVDGKVLDLDTNIFRSGTQRVRRFHDKYHNETLIAKAGVVGKSYADRLLLGVVVGQEYQQIQHGADMSFVYGKRYRTANTLMPTLLYQKRLRDRELVVDQFSGTVLSEQRYPLAVLLADLSLRVHAGRIGLVWAVMLAAPSLNILFFLYSGLAITKKRWTTRTANKYGASEAKYILLVGSENGSTLRFANAVHTQLLAHQQLSYLAELNHYGVFPQASHVVVFTSTHGLGDAPSNAKQLAALVAQHPQSHEVQISIVGFGS